jgi:hypothetical protein
MLHARSLTGHSVSPVDPLCRVGKLDARWHEVLLLGTLGSHPWEPPLGTTPEWAEWAEWAKWAEQGGAGRSGESQRKTCGGPLSPCVQAGWIFT